MLLEIKFRNPTLTEEKSKTLMRLETPAAAKSSPSRSNSILQNSLRKPIKLAVLVKLKHKRKERTSQRE